MININNKVYVDFLIDGTSYLTQVEQFNYLIVEENLGLEAPIFEISLTLRDDSILKNFKINKKCKIKFGRGKDTAVTYDFLLINYVLDTTKGEGGGFQITLSGIADIMDFYFKNKIEVFNDKKSNEAIQSCVTTINAEVNYTGNDKMHWIRHNTSERQFVLETLLHSWISENTYPIFGVTIDKKLKIKDAQKALNELKANIQNTDNCTPSSICYDALHIESNNAITSLFLGSGKLQPILNIKDWKRQFLTTDLKSLNGKNYFEKISSNSFKTQLNTYSTHDYYFAALARNLSKWSQFEMNCMYIKTDLFLSESDLTLGDAVKYIPPKKNISLNSLSGNWIVSGKIYQFGKRKISTKIKVCRDFINS